jgi:hypothetical protein
MEFSQEVADRYKGGKLRYERRGQTIEGVIAKISIKDDVARIKLVEAAVQPNPIEIDLTEAFLRQRPDYLEVWPSTEECYILFP